MGEMQGILMGDVVCEECPQKRKRVGADKQGEKGEKVTEIEFFDIGNHAENGYLSTDKVTKFSDKVFV